MAEPSPEAFSDFRVVWLGVVTVALWVASRSFDLWQSWDRRTKDKDAFIRAIYAEVAFNTFDMSRFLNATVPVSRLDELFSNKDFIPHITDARHTDIYRNGIGELHALAMPEPTDVDLVGDIVRFYGELEKITQQIEGLLKPSFSSISPKGKSATISRIYATCETSERIGKELMINMETKFSHLGLKSRASHWEDEEKLGTQSREQLSVRLQQLGSDLDRINATRHSGSPL